MTKNQFFDDKPHSYEGVGGKSKENVNKHIPRKVTQTIVASLPRDIARDLKSWSALNGLPINKTVEIAFKLLKKEWKNGIHIDLLN